MNSTSNEHTKSELPVIDISTFGEGSEADDVQVAKLINAACVKNGFFYVVGHGVPASATAELYNASKAFFALSEGEKNTVNKNLSHCNRGYEALAAQTLEPGAPPDQKEGYYIGVEIPESDTRVQAGKFNHGPNQWPELPRDFRPAAEEYFELLTRLGIKLMKALALSLELPRDYFNEFTSNPMCTLRILHYPPQRPTATPDEKGCGAHTDFGGLTLLWQDNVGGLEVFDKKTNEWITAQPLEGAFVVNLGDMIQRWTNENYKSTLHRVINRSGRERYSIPFFFTGNPDFKVRCIESCLKNGESPKAPPITVSEHIQEMYRRTYS